MKNSYWVAVVITVFIAGIIVGYGVWAPDAAKLPEMQKELRSAQAEVAKFKKETGDLKANLGEITNQKLNLEKDNAELKETLEKATKKRR